MVGVSSPVSLLVVSDLCPIKRGKVKFQGNIRRLLSKSKESHTHHGRFIYKNLIKKYAVDLTSHFNRVAKGRAGANHAALFTIIDLSVPLISHIVFKSVLDSLTKESKRTALAGKLGQLMQDELNFSQLKNKFPDWYAKLDSKVQNRASYHYKRNLIIRVANSDLGDSWKTDFGHEIRTQIGMGLLELFRQSTQLIKFINRKHGKHKTVSYVVPTEATLEWISEFNNRLANLLPYYLPTTTIPIDWTSVISGGYEFPSGINWHFIKSKQRQSLKDRCASSDLSIVFAAANKLQQTPFVVSKDVLSVLKKVLPIRTTTEVNPFGNFKYTKEYRQCQARIHSRKRKEIPKLIQQQTVLNIATEFEDRTFYFPVQSDFRGRLYYVPKTFNPQGPDLARGLMKFKQAEHVRGHEDWFLINGANRYGIKGSFQDRQEWTLKHEKWITGAATDPYNNSFWEDAESPAEFLQFAIEFKEWMSNRISFKSHLPVKLDHTASGMQIIAMLTGDPELQRLTNISNSTEPVDMYAVLLNSIGGKLMTSGRPESIAWLSLGLDRSLVKQLTVMYMYGGTPHGMQQVVVDWYKQLPEDIFKREVYIEIGKLLSVYYESLDELTEAPRLFMHDCQRKVKKEEPYEWTSQSGFPVNNNYNKTKSKRLRTTVNREAISFHVSVPTDELCYRKSKAAIAANTIHSHDAALLHTVLNKCDFPVLALHDCYGVHPHNVNKLRANVKKSMNELFGVDTQMKMPYVLA